MVSSFEKELLLKLNTVAGSNLVSQKWDVQEIGSSLKHDEISANINIRYSKERQKYNSEELDERKGIR